MAKSTYLYVSYIRTTPEKLWKALTDPEFTKQYWFGIRSETEWRAGSAWKLVADDGKVWDAGEVVEVNPPRRLVLRRGRVVARTKPAQTTITWAGKDEAVRFLKPA